VPHDLTEVDIVWHKLAAVRQALRGRSTACFPWGQHRPPSGPPLKTVLVLRKGHNKVDYYGLDSERSDIVQYRINTISVTPYRVKPGISQVGHSSSCDATKHVVIVMFISPELSCNEDKNTVVLVETPKVPFCTSPTGARIATEVTLHSQL
jgi:hypothetical protein